MASAAAAAHLIAGGSHAPLLGFALAASVLPVLMYSTGRRGADADREPEAGPAASDHGFAAAGANDDAATHQGYRPRSVVRMDDACRLGRRDIAGIALSGLVGR